MLDLQAIAKFYNTDDINFVEKHLKEEVYFSNRFCNDFCFCIGDFDGLDFIPQENGPFIAYSIFDPSKKENENLTAIQFYWRFEDKDTNERTPILYEVDRFKFCDLDYDLDKSPCIVYETLDNRRLFGIYATPEVMADLNYDNYRDINTAGEVYKVDGKWLSENTLKEDTYVCASCGGRHLFENAYFVVQDATKQDFGYGSRGSLVYCKDCFPEVVKKEDIVNCRGNYWAYRKDVIKYKGSYYSKWSVENEWEISDISGKKYPQNEIFYGFGPKDESVCATAEEYENSPEYLTLITPEDETMYVHEKSNDLKFVNGKPYIIETCPVYNYHSDKVEFVPIYQDKKGNIRQSKAKNDKRTYYGVELECEGDYFNSVIVEDEFRDLFVCEDDSSLGSTGFEIISQPLTWECWEYYHDRVAYMFNLLKQNGQKADKRKSCGLHIHVSKTAFKDKRALSRARWIVSVFKEDIEKFARRRENNYCEYDDVKLDKGKYYTYRKAGRHTAFNDEKQSNPTVEFRMFQGTLNTLVLYASLEFVKNIVEVANSDKKTICFNDFLKGKYIEKYIKARKMYFNSTEKQ